MMRRPLRLGIVLALVMVVPAGAQPARTPPAALASVAPADLPDRTNAAFGDWSVRCETQRPQGQPVNRVCEVALTMNDQRGQPIAQVVLSQPSRAAPHRMLV